MKDLDSEQQLRREFGEFLSATPVTPSEVVNQTVRQKVAQDLEPAAWRVYGKMTWIELMTGLATLTICPQFGFGYDHDLGLLHALHSVSPGALYYLLCGMLFVSFGGVLTGLLLTRGEVRQVVRGHYGYFLFFALAAYGCLIALGTEVFVLSSLFWVPGAIIGNIAGFKLLEFRGQCT